MEYKIQPSNMQYCAETYYIYIYDGCNLIYLYTYKLELLV